MLYWLYWYESTNIDAERVRLDGTFRGQVIPAKIHADMLEFVTDCVAVPQTWRVLREQVLSLLALLVQEYKCRGDARVRD